MVRRRNNNRSRRNISNRRNPARAIRNFINGGKRRVGCNPKPITYDPWNSLTLQFQYTGKDTDVDKDFTIEDLDLAIRNQLDLPPQFYYTKTNVKDIQKFLIYMKLQSVTVYDIASRPVGLSLFDLSPQRSDQLAELTPSFTSLWDYPGHNSWASVRAMFPAYMQRTPLMNWDKTSGGQPVFRTISTEKAFTHLITVKLLWKSCTELGDIIRSVLVKPESGTKGIDNKIAAKTTH